MVSKLIQWAVYNPLIVLLMAAGLVAAGTYAFLQRQRRSLSRPGAGHHRGASPSIPARSAEEVERQVTIPLEVALAGMPGLTYTAQQVAVRPVPPAQPVRVRRRLLRSPAGSHQPPAVRPGTAARRHAAALAVHRRPAKSAATRSTAPRTPPARTIYTLNDLKALQDWVLEREFRRIPRIVDVDQLRRRGQALRDPSRPDRLKRYGITLQQLQNALTNANANVGGDYLNQGGTRHERARHRPVRRRRGPRSRCVLAHDATLAAGGLALACARTSADASRRHSRASSSRRSTTSPIRVDDCRRGRPASPGDLAGKRASWRPTSPGWAGSAISRPRKDAERQRDRARRRTASASGATRTTRCRASCCCARTRPPCRPWRRQAEVDELNDHARPAAAGREDRAALRPHRPDRTSPPRRCRRTCRWAWSW